MALLTDVTLNNTCLKNQMNKLNPFFAHLNRRKKRRIDYRNQKKNQYRFTCNLHAEIEAQI